MTFATDPLIQQKPLSFDAFLARYGDDNRYELIDREVFDLEPTGQHEEVAAFITTKVCVQIDGAGLPWFVLQRGLFRPSNLGITSPFGMMLQLLIEQNLIKNPPYPFAVFFETDDRYGFSCGVGAEPLTVALAPTLISQPK